jgi:diadenosine tetraphosphate (Ap4A) HIT family hydrolase
MTFELHPHLKKKSWIVDLPLSTILMEDNANYPWLFVVPRKSGAQRIIDLTEEEQIQLTKELNLVQNILWKEFTPTQLNVAAIGNKTPQLHVHVICRFEHDPAWPNTVWDHPLRTAFTESAKKERILRLQALLPQTGIN